MAKTNKTKTKETKSKESPPEHRYVTFMPKEVPAGCYLCHNHVRHTQRSKPGPNGFRAWTTNELSEKFGPCNCGWSGLPHYASKESAGTRMTAIEYETFCRSELARERRAERKLPPIRTLAEGGGRKVQPAKGAK